MNGAEPEKGSNAYGRCGNGPSDGLWCGMPWGSWGEVNMGWSGPTTIPEPWVDVGPPSPGDAASGSRSADPIEVESGMLVLSAINGTVRVTLLRDK